MVEVTLLSGKQNPPQFYGGEFKIKGVQPHATYLSIELERDDRRATMMGDKKKTWRRAHIRISPDDIPPLVAALVDQLNLMNDRIREIMNEVDRGAQIYVFQSSHYADIDWKRISDVLKKSKRKLG